MKSSSGTGASASTARKALGRTPSRKSIETKQRIMDIAASLFAEKGYGLTRLGDIADLAGIHLSALYYYFDTKEDLATEVLAYVPRQASTAVHQALDSLPTGTTHRDRIAHAIRIYIRNILSQDNYVRAHLQIGRQAPARIREQAIEITRQESETWRRLLEAALADGAIRDDINLTLTRMILFGAMNWSIEWFRQGTQTIEHFSDHVVKLIFDGISPRSEIE